MKLSLNNLNVERHDKLLFRGLTCELHPGELLQICGANGSGKSTLLRILAGLLELPHGQILWQDVSIQTQRETYSQQIQYIGHHNGIKPNLTAYENLACTTALLPNKVGRHQIEFALYEIGLKQVIHKPALSFSAGQLRRLALARLLLKPTKPLWILDEPTTALDTSGQEIFTTLLNQHLNQGGMAVVATHQLLNFATCKTIHLGKSHGTS